MPRPREDLVAVRRCYPVFWFGNAGMSGHCQCVSVDSKFPRFLKSSTLENVPLFTFPNPFFPRPSPCLGATACKPWGSGHRVWVPLATLAAVPLARFARFPKAQGRSLLCYPLEVPLTLMPAGFPNRTTKHTVVSDSHKSVLSNLLFLRVELE